MAESYQVKIINDTVKKLLDDGEVTIKMGTPESIVLLCAMDSMAKQSKREFFLTKDSFSL